MIQDVRSNARLQARAGRQVNRTLEEIRQFALHAAERQKSDPCARLKLHQDIGVTVRSEISAHC